MASIHQKTKNGTWYINYRQNGTLKHRSLATRNPRVARRLQKEFELKLDSNPNMELVVNHCPKTQQKDPPIDVFWQQFLEWAEMHRSPGRVEEYSNWFRQYIDFSGINRLGETTPEQTRAFVRRLAIQGVRKPTGVGLAKISINNAIKTLRSLWNHAQKLGLYTGDNPFSSLETFRLPQRPVRAYLSAEDVSALFRATEQHVGEKNVRILEYRNVHLAIALMALAGLRRREVCFARWEWVNWENKLFTISNHSEFSTKNRRNRVVSMHDDLVAILQPYRKEKGYILESTRKSSGKSRYRADFKKGFRRVCDLAGVQATPHDLRHSFASRHAVAGTSLHVIAGWLGHSTTSVTERYAHFQMGYNEATNNI